MSPKTHGHAKKTCFKIESCRYCARPGIIPGIESHSTFKIEGQELTVEGLHAGDLLLAKPAQGDVEGKIVIALYDKNKVIIRRDHTRGTLAHFSVPASTLPDIRTQLNLLT